ncbi:mammalian cell entry protein [Mycolicibacter sinensis]|uniref:Mammalian cell entry protein n=1 Tax=Mycolicibacter sinensis (strain JDM601) TaxID=875328 RepID=A0A1A2DUV2_MYCSD|nr:mammalian cell entry protein [Mycolicibacter sinensis]OBG00579.1 mammalian cell entry protein [Mycolicibacter sinensis]
MEEPGTGNGKGRRRVSALVAALVAGALILVAVGGYYLNPFGGHLTVTAQFDSAAGLYQGNVVAVLGMPVGKVKKVTPKGGYVEAEFTVDRDVKIPADVHAVTINTSILTARQIELTPVYAGGPVLADRTTIGLNRTRTPVAFDRVLDMLDKVSKSLGGDGKGNGPVADVINAGADIADGNGEKIKSALSELSRALQLSSDRGEATGDQLTTIITNLSSLMDAAARNDAKLRQFGSTTRQLSQMLANEDFGTGRTGRKFNEIVTQATTLLQANRDHLKQAILNGDTAVTTLVEKQRDLAELINLLPLTLENIYNTVDTNNGAVRLHALADKILVDSQSTKELCNMMHLRQLGCGTGTLADYGPDFGLTYVLDGLSMMGQ